MIGLLLTILFPGLGHFYYGKILRGAIFAGVSFIPFVYPFALILALIDVYKLSKSGIKPELSRREAVTVVILCFLLPLFFLFVVLTVGPRALNYIGEQAKPKKNQERIDDIAKGLDNYFSSYQRYPENLKELIKDNPLRKKWLLDSWGHPFVYEADESKKIYKLISIGKDGEPDTEDDIIVKSGSE